MPLLVLLLLLLLPLLFLVDLFSGFYHILLIRSSSWLLWTATIGSRRCHSVRPDASAAYHLAVGRRWLEGGVGGGGV